MRNRIGRALTRASHDERAGAALPLTAAALEKRLGTL